MVDPMIPFLAALPMVHFVFFSMSRGGMLGLGTIALVSFVLLPKRPRNYLYFGLAVVLCFMLAGNDVQEEFFSTFKGEEERDASAQSRIVFWRACLDLMGKYPLLGAGPDHFPVFASTYGFKPGRESHTLWLNFGAEIGIPGLMLILTYYGLCMFRLWQLLRDPDPWLCSLARMVIVSSWDLAWQPSSSHSTCWRRPTTWR